MFEACSKERIQPFDDDEEDIWEEKEIKFATQTKSRNRSETVRLSLRAYTNVSTRLTKMFSNIQGLVDHSHLRAKQSVKPLKGQQLLELKPLLEKQNVFLRRETIPKTLILS